MIEKERRKIFLVAVGEQVEVRRQHHRKLAERVNLIKVNRTRAVVEIHGAPLRIVEEKTLTGPKSKLVREEWSVPLAWLILPGCLESDPRQMELFK